MRFSLRPLLCGIGGTREEEDKLQDMIRRYKLHVVQDTLGMKPASTESDSSAGPPSGRKRPLGIALLAKDNNSKREIFPLPSIQLYVRREAFRSS